MITEDQTNRLFNVVTEVGIETALEVLREMRNGVEEHNGRFIDGFDYAICTLEKANEIMKGQEGNG